MRGLLFSTLVAVALLGCSGERARTASETGLRVALLTPGPISDQSWNAGAYQGLLWIRDSLGAAVSHIQTRTPAEFEENFREYGRQGYDLVFGHGFEFQDAAARIAPLFPSTTYIVTSSTVSGPNVVGLGFAFDQPSYLAGMVAGGVTRSGVIGAIGGQELPPVVESFEAYAAGAREVNPGVRVVTSYIGNWDDVSAGKEQALAQIAQGVDVIFQNADAAGLGVFQAARETRRALVFGSNGNQNAVAPDVILASVVIDLPRAYLTVARAVQADTLAEGPLRLDARSGAVYLELNPQLADRVPGALRAQVDSAWQRLLRGESVSAAGASGIRPR